MDFGLEGKKALVTASSRGLGRACAEELAREGCDLAMCARGWEELRKAAEEVEDETGSKAVPFQADVSVAQDLEALIDGAEEALGGVDILVANAGGPPNGEFEDFGERDWMAALQLNLLSVVRLARGVLPGMVERGWGRVVLPTSVSVKEPLPGLVLSNSVRAAVHGLAKSLSNRYASEGVTVNCVLPGYTLTERMEELFGEEAEERGIPLEERLGEVAEDIPAGRLGEPEEFAAAVAFLCSERASYVTGTGLQVDGGFVGSPP